MQIPGALELIQRLTIKEARQLIFWAILTAAFTGVCLYGHATGMTGAQIYQYVIMYVINSVVFFSLYRYYSELGMTMLIFILFFELSVFGYYFFSAVSLAA